MRIKSLSLSDIKAISSNIDAKVNLKLRNLLLSFITVTDVTNKIGL